MTFDEFLSRRSAELLRFAFVICGDRVAAESLVEQAALRVFADLGERDDPDAWAAAARVWTVRGFLSEGMVLGAPVASDVDTLIDAAHPAHGLVDNFARSSRLQRAVLVLHYREHFSEAEIANLVGSSEAGIVSYIGAILERLDVSAPGHPRGNSEQDLRRVLHVLGTDLAPADDLYTRISLALPQPVPTEAELAAAEVAAAEAAAAEAARAAELAEAEAALAAEVAAAEAAAAELAEAEAAAAAAELEALVTSIAAGTASEVATHVAADTAAGVAAEVAGATATEAATSLATTIAIDVARSTATDVATTVSTDVASRTAADVATGVATTTAGEVARLTAADVASSTAADVATGVAGKVARATATDVATTVSTTTANEVARATATDVASAVSTEVASSTATEVATGVATDVATTTAGEVARATATEVASSTATEVATGVATDVATTTAGEVARATATDVATDIATASAADVAAMTAVTATGVATEVATTTANDVAAGVARDVATSTADEIATRTASAVATDLATTTATDIATTTATDVALSIATSTASEVATAKATDVAASVSTDVASEVALTVATDAATRIATDVATHIAAAAVADAVAGAVADAVAHALVVAAPGAAPASEPTPESEPATDAIAEPLAVAEPRTITERVPVSEPPDGLEIAGSDLTPNEPDTAEPDQPAEITDDEPRDDDLPQEQLAEEAQDSPEESGAVELPAPDDPTVEVQVEQVQVEQVQVEQVQVEQVQARPTPSYLSAKLVRPLIVLAALLGVNYVVWRWTYSVNWTAWWISVPLVVAETYSLIGALLFGLTMWRLRKRAEPGPPPEGATVDVFIATYNEPIELVMKTAYAAQRINYPHTLWILDDGNRPELKELAEAEGIGVISRSSDWIDMPRHAKAGNLNSALMVTQGQFVVILDADQIPAPELLDHTLGYFSDKKMAFVQTPQCFSNVPQSDPLGSRTSLFFGPIQQGKDGWNSALFCGSNTVLRREALLQLGVRRYVLELELRIQDALDTTEKIIGNALAGLPSGQKKAGDALSAVLAAAQAVHDELDGGMSVADATARFQNVIKKLSRDVVGTDLAASQADLAELFDLLGDDYVESPATALNAEALERLARRDWSPLGAVETVRALLAAVDVDREDEAQPIMPMSTISVTEDLTTCMSIHGKGWKSAYHDEILAVGLAPEDLGTMLTQRLRRAQGTMQVMLRVNPLRQKGLSAAQRLMYLSTTWTYLSGFAAIVYIVAPAIFLLFGVLPVNSLNAQLFARLVPFFVLDQLLFLVVGRGRHTWRSRQFLFVLFPVWIKAVTSGVGNVVRRRSLSLAVTPKTRLKVDRLPWRLVPVQLLAVALLVVAAVVGIVRYSVGDAGHSGGLGTIVNIVWVVLDLALFSAIPRALYFKGFTPAPDESAAPAAPTLSPTVDRHETSITTSR